MNPSAPTIPWPKVHIQSTTAMLLSIEIDSIFVKRVKNNIKRQGLAHN